MISMKIKKEIHKLSHSLLHYQKKMLCMIYIVLSALLYLNFKQTLLHLQFEVNMSRAWF